MNRTAVITAILLTAFLAGCCFTQPTPQPTTTEPSTPYCQKPYIEYMAGECCLDRNDNNICDKDEATTQQTQQTEETQQTTQATQQTTQATTTQQGPTTTLNQCPQGQYTSSTCGSQCPAGQLCSASGVSITVNGQQTACYKCNPACPTNDPEKTYFFKNNTCANSCNTSGEWYCMQSTTQTDCYFCARPCPAGYYYKNSTCKNQCQTGTSCTNSTQNRDCYWCKNPCPEGYYFNDSRCAGVCDLHQSCEKTTDNCYLCNSKCSVGYYFNDSTCRNECDIEDVCRLLTGTQKCYYCGASTTTTSWASTTTRATTTTAASPTTTVVQCLGSLYGTSNCNNQCNAECEECGQYQSTPCYYCQDLDCQDVDIVLYNTFNECQSHCQDGMCNISSTCSHCYECQPYVCGNGDVEPGEQCEEDADCVGYGYCDINCECQPDCDAYCDDQGVDGYQWINDFLGPVITSSAQCQNWATQKLQQITQNCFTSCVASSSYTYNGVYSCCCVDWNSLPCQNCPGQNPVCPPLEDCMDTL